MDSTASAESSEDMVPSTPTQISREGNHNVIRKHLVSHEYRAL
jgi:hypothetical protein